MPTVAGSGLGMETYVRKPLLDKGSLGWKAEPERSSDLSVIASVHKPFSTSGGLKVLSGNLGRAVIKVSALADGADTVVEAPAMVFHTQEELRRSMRADCTAVSSPWCAFRGRSPRVCRSSTN